MALQNVFILGATWNVWSTLIDQINSYDESNHEHTNPTRIVGIANSRHYALSTWGIILPASISWENLLQVLKDKQVSTPYSSHDQILESVKKSGMEWEVIFIDATADGNSMVEFHKKVIGDSTNRIVTANKKPAAAEMQTFESLTKNPHRYRYNTTVMAWAGSVPYFQEAHGLSEKIESVEGTFSGTLAYVCSELEKWTKKFSQIVKEARDMGFTEPHPIDDLNGEDVRRKLLILLRSAGIRIDEKEVILKGLVSSEMYTWLSPDAFLEVIKNEDNSMEDRIKSASREWLVPRYIASYKKNSNKMVAEVGLQFVSKESELGNLKWTANKLLVHTSQRTPLWNAPHIIQSPWAWVWKTAASVRADLLYLLSGTNLWQHT